MPDSKSLTGILDLISEEAGRDDKISIGEINEILNSRGFGPLLLGPSLLIVLPTGAIPGVPAFFALFILLVAVQIIFGRSHPWLPERVSNFSFSREKFDQISGKVKPYTKRVDRYIRPQRWKFLTGKPAQIILSVVIVILSIVIITVGFLPLAPFLPGLAILLFALGLSARDGMFVVCGFVFMIAAFCTLPFIFIMKPE